MQRKPKIENHWIGHIDGITGRRIYGWIKNKSAAEVPAAIDIYIDGVKVASNIVADIHRQDVENAGHGNGKFGFSVQIKDAPQSKAESITVSISEHASSNKVLSKSFTTLAFKDHYQIHIDIANSDVIEGWCVNTNRKSEVFDIKLVVNGAPMLTTRNDLERSDLKQKDISSGKGGFRLKNPLRWLPEGDYKICLQFPDGTRSENSTVVVHDRKKLTRVNLTGLEQRNVTIIVPIFNAPEDVSTCIERLLKHTPTWAKILLIDDCSTDSRIASILSSVRNVEQIRIIKNAKNLGFTGTVNKGIQSTPDDVILLNSDARVTPGWLQSMLIAAYSSRRVATVTAMSDRAGAFSAPNIGNENPLPAHVSEESYSRFFRRSSLGLYPKVPTGNGFCMFISRKCITELGLLDVQAFPRGYGEENDFCMRALRSGWHNLIDDRTYVFHDRSKSFGANKDLLVTQGRRVVDERYPEYKELIKTFSTSDKISAARFCAGVALKQSTNREELLPRVAFVVATSTGGTPQTNMDLMQGLVDAFETWTLRCDSRVITLSRFKQGVFETVATHTLAEPIEPVTHRSDEYEEVVATWLFHYAIDLVHIRHLGWHSCALPTIVKTLGKKLVFSFHDYYTLSPTIKLIDDSGAFLGHSYEEERSIYRESLWPESPCPTPNGIWLTHWKGRFEKELIKCDALITTSHSAKALITRELPLLPHSRFKVIPHGRDLQGYKGSRQQPQHGEKIKILIPGNIDAAKGLGVIYALAQHDRAGLLEFHVLGDLNTKNLQRMGGSLPHPRILLHGKYERKDFPKHAARIGAHLGGVFSIWDETYCHTLTELWSVGLPTIVFNFPNLAERVKSSGAGWVLEHTNIDKLYEDILRISLNADEQLKADAALRAWRVGEGARNTARLMASHYLDVYRAAFNENAITGEDPAGHIPRVGVACPSETSLDRANASTVIRVWERTRNRLDRKVTYVRMLPDSLIANIISGSIDVALIQRNVLPRTLVDTFISACLSTRTPYIIDLDDDLLNIPGDKEGMASYADYTPWLARLVSDATVVTTSTDTLFGLYSRLNPNVFVLPNKLSDRLWKLPDPRHKRGTGCNALYMGTATHKEDLLLILSALDRVAAEFADFRLSIIGVASDDELLVGRERWLDRIAVPDDAKYYENFVPWLLSQSNRFDFALAPLVEGTFNQGKSSLKVLDYAALGLPVLASNVDIYQIDAPELTLVDNNELSWADAMKTFISDSHKADMVARAERQLAWARSRHMLSSTLDSFDRMIIDTVAMYAERNSEQTIGSV